MIFGYTRVSTQVQNLDSQIELLTKYGVDEIVKEICAITGVSQAAFYRRIKEMEQDA